MPPSFFSGCVPPAGAIGLLSTVRYERDAMAGLATSASSRCMNASGAVASRGLELEHEHHLRGGVGLDALVGQCRAGDVAAQLLQRLAVVSPAAHGGTQADAVDVDAQRLLGLFRLPGHCTLHLSTFCPARGPMAKR